MTALQPAIVLAFGVALVAAVPAEAQEVSETRDTVTVAEGEGSANSGRVAINIAAGSQNQQIGSAVIAIGEVPLAVHGATQDIATADMTDRATLVTVGPNAFSDNSGLLSVNVSAGTRNQTANLALLTVGTTGAVSDQMLAQSSAPTKPSGPSARGLDTPNDAIAIDDSALGGNSGLVQINLVGGERNSSANTFALNVSAGG